MENLYALILAGGSGTRFWPASRRLRPKQLLPLAPGSSQPLIAETVERLSPLCAPERIYVSTGAHLLDATRRALPTLPQENFLAEPIARNTAPCIAWATSVIGRRDPDATIIVVPSDQHVADVERYHQALQRAVASAQQGVITTIGIRPSRPETGYGYIEADVAGSGELDQPLKARRFVEKPNDATAEKYLAAGNFYWNAGMFFFKASTMLAALAKHMPELEPGLTAIERAEAEGPEALEAAVSQAFESWPSISIDYGIMERVEQLCVVPADMGWSDLGSWQAAWELADKDASGNVAQGDVWFHESKGNLVSDLSTGQKRAIAVVGVEGLCVVQTDDALLVIRRDQSQEVKQILESLKKAGREDLV